MHFNEDENGCCTQVILKNFGEEVPDYINNFQKNSPSAKDFPEFVERLRERVKEFDDEYGKDEEFHEADFWDPSGWADPKWFRCRAIVTATTVDTQPIAEGFLKQFGFRRVGPIKKRKHKVTKLSFWYLRVSTFLRLLEKHEKELA